MSSLHRQSTAQPAGRHSMAPTPSRPAGNTELPPYRKPSHPMNPAAQQKLLSIYSGRHAGMVEDYSQKATINITETAALVNEHLRDKIEATDRRRKKWEKGAHVDEQELWEGELGVLEDKVNKVTERLEKSMRDAIDDAEAARRIKESLKWLQDNAHRQMEQEYVTQVSQREQSQTQDGPTPGPTPLNQDRIALKGLGPMYNERLERKKVEYTSFSHNARYAQNNEYIGFKTTVHGARYDDDYPLPHPDTWFDEHGAPAPGITATQARADDDDDIIIDKATISTRCPITFHLFKEPYTSKKCPHTFEKYAILDMIRHSAHKKIQCPVSGCDHHLSASDLHSDRVITRKIQRIQAAEAQGDEESDSDDDAVASPRRQTVTIDENNDRPNVATHLKNEPTPTGQRPPPSSEVVDLGDPSDSDEDE